VEDARRDVGVIYGHVKWYDAIKGYGFVVPEQGGSDVMIHSSCVRAFGKVALGEGSKVTLVAQEGPRGLQAQKLMEVIEPEVGVAAPGIAETEHSAEFPATEAGPLEPARVKWFDKQKGFGFINVFGKPEDVFVHMETVRRCGFQDLAWGEAIVVRTFRGPRGLMVAEVHPWESAAQSEGG